MAIMFTGIAVLGVLAGSLADLFKLSGSPDGTAPAAGAGSVHEELLGLRDQLQTLEARLGELAEQARVELAGPLTRSVGAARRTRDATPARPRATHGQR
jgi:hypothetical protein